MTLSPDTQRTERLRLLTAMMDAVGDTLYDGHRFPVKDFPDVHGSAWKELQDDGLVAPKHSAGRPAYGLTAAGWLTALKETDRFNSPEVMERCKRLMQVLKQVTDNAQTPHHDELFDWQYAVPAKTGLPPCWVFNALSSGLLGARFPNHRINHYFDPRVRNFRIPSNFGRKHID